jgi:hypothetical protein
MYIELPTIRSYCPVCENYYYNLYENIMMCPCQDYHKSLDIAYDRIKKWIVTCLGYGGSKYDVP